MLGVVIGLHLLRPLVEISFLSNEDSDDCGHEEQGCEDHHYNEHLNSFHRGVIIRREFYAKPKALVRTLGMRLLEGDGRDGQVNLFHDCSGGSSLNSNKHQDDDRGYQTEHTSA